MLQVICNESEHLHIPNGDNLVALLVDRPTSKLSFYTTSDVTTPLGAAHKNKLMYSPAHTLTLVAVESEIL